MTQELLVAGGGIGGLACALAARRAGWEVRLFEQAEAFSEVGAGLQLGPNATRILQEWGLLRGELLARCVFPQWLRVRDAGDGGELAALRLGEDFEARYGAPYVTAHRADLHMALLGGARTAGTRLHTGTRVAALDMTADAVGAVTSGGLQVEADAAVAADGVWSALRTRLVGDGPAKPTGHVAYRALVAQAQLPAQLRSGDVTAWLGPRMHLVSYPVRGGEALNIVCVVQGELLGGLLDWDHPASAADLHRATGVLPAAARELVDAVPAWRQWVLHDRAPVRGAAQMALGRVAFAGDAAHPMRPYLAQGAAMAIEDARALERVLSVADGRTLDVPTALQRYALDRWQRCGRVQARSRRNGRIFHADGFVRWGRNLALRALGERLLDVPWLYRG